MSPGLGSAAEVVGVGAVHEARRDRAEEEESVTDDRAADRAADLVAMIRLLVVLDEPTVRSSTGDSTSRLTGPALRRAAQIVVVPLAPERVAAGLGDRADDAAERAAVFSRNADGLDLHFLQVFEDGVLARLRRRASCSSTTPSTVNWFSEPLAPLTWNPPSMSPEITDGAVMATDWKLRPFGIRSNLFGGHVVRDRSCCAYRRAAWLQP